MCYRIRKWLLSSTILCETTRPRADPCLPDAALQDVGAAGASLGCPGSGVSRASLAPPPEGPLGPPPPARLGVVCEPRTSPRGAASPLIGLAHLCQRAPGRDVAALPVLGSEWARGLPRGPDSGPRGKCKRKGPAGRRAWAAFTAGRAVGPWEALAHVHPVHEGMSQWLLSNIGVGMAAGPSLL